MREHEVPADGSIAGSTDSDSASVPPTASRSGRRAVLIALAVVVAGAVAAAAVVTRSDTPGHDADGAVDQATAARQTGGSFRMHQVSGDGTSGEPRSVTDTEV